MESKKLEKPLKINDFSGLRGQMRRDEKVKILLPTMKSLDK